MNIDRTNLDLVFAGFKSVFQAGLDRAPGYREIVSMEVPSQAGEEVYGWLGTFPKIREWLGDRVINSLTNHQWRIRNRSFELTISVPRVDIEDDKVGLFKPLFDEMGRDTKQHPDELCFGLLKEGFDGLCYDGKPFFAEDHPVIETNVSTTTASNMLDGSGPPWFLIDTSRGIRPLVWQTRIPYDFTAMTDPTSERVFFRDDYLYGVRARANAGYGVWQLAFGSKAALNAANYEAARKAMASLTTDFGKKLNIRPTHLVCGSALEGDAFRLINNTNRVEGGYLVGNEWAGTVEVVVTPYVD